MKMNDNAYIVELGVIATVIICIMTFITFMYTVGVWEQEFWESDLDGLSVLGYDGSWGEDIVVIYPDNVTESVKSITNNYWSSMAIQNEGSRSISIVTYCLNAKIPVADTFNILDYHCNVFVVQNGIDFYQTSYVGTGSIDIHANEWTRIITVSLDIQSISSSWDDGTYIVSFENIGVIEGVNVPSGLSLDIVIKDGAISFLL